MPTNKKFTTPPPLIPSLQVCDFAAINCHRQVTSWNNSAAQKRERERGSGRERLRERQRERERDRERERARERIRRQRERDTESDRASERGRDTDIIDIERDRDVAVLEHLKQLYLYQVMLNLEQAWNRIP